MKYCNPCRANLPVKRVLQKLSINERVERIQNRCYQEFGFKRENVMRGGSRELSECRMVVWYIIRKCGALLTQAKCGHLYMKEPSTVLYGVRTVSGWIDIDKKYKDRIESLILRIVDDGIIEESDTMRARQIKLSLFRTYGLIGSQSY